VKKRKRKSKQTDMLRSIGKQCANILFGVSPGEQKEGYVGKDLPKRDVSTLK